MKMIIKWKNYDFDISYYKNIVIFNLIKVGLFESN